LQFTDPDCFTFQPMTAKLIADAVLSNASIAADYRLERFNA
jgi:hypothetical protein